MNSQAMWAIARKDIRAIAANVQVWLPMLILPVVLGVFLPAGVVLGARIAGISGMDEMQQMLQWLERMPDSPLKQTLDRLPSLDHRLIYLFANYMLAPFFLLIPLMASSVISADSFAGEKERGTLESLLFTPADLLSLLAGKVLAAFLPAVGLSLVTFALSAAAVNMVGWPLFGALFFPSLNWLPLMLLVIPALSLAAILVNVFISARVSSFQAAYQLGGLVVLPVLALLFGQISGALLLDAWVLTAAGLGLAALDLVLLRFMTRRLDRNRLFESQVR